MEVVLILISLPLSSPFLWNLFGNQGCNCCRCHSNFPIYPERNNFFSYAVQNHLQYPTTPTYQTAPIFQTFHYPPRGFSSLPTSTPGYRGPPAAAPISTDQLYLSVPRYSTNQVAYHSEIRPVTSEGYGDQALTQLEEELAAEKYRYNLHKEQEKKQKEKQQKIRVFKIKPHKSNTGMVEWQNSQVAKYTNEKAVMKFAEAANVNDANEEDLEEFIPIEIGNEPELAAEEPAGPPPTVRNKISNDPVLNLRKRFVLT